MPELPTPAGPALTGSTLATPAWVMAGWGRHVPGALVAGHGRLAFLAEDGPLFDVPIMHVTDVAWPWHWFGGGVVLSAAGTPYKIAFIMPNGARPPAPSLLADGVALVSAAAGAVPSHSLAGFLDIRRGRDAARLWRSVLPGV